MLRTRDFIRSLLAHLRGVGPIVLASQHIDWTSLGIDGVHPVTAIPSACTELAAIAVRADSFALLTKVKVEIAVENAIRLCTVQVPDELTIDERCSWAHHAVDPLWVVQGLVDEWRAIVPLSVHVQVIATLHGDCTHSAHLLVADGYRQADLSGHRCAADNRLLEPNLLDESSDEAHIGIFGVGMLAYSQ